MDAQANRGRQRKVEKTGAGPRKKNVEIFIHPSTDFYFIYFFIYLMSPWRRSDTPARATHIKKTTILWGSPRCWETAGGFFLRAGTAQSRPTRKNSADMDMAPASRRKTPQEAWKTHLQSQGGIPPAAPTNQAQRMWCGRHRHLTSAT